MAPTRGPMPLSGRSAHCKKYQHLVRRRLARTAPVAGVVRHQRTGTPVSAHASAQAHERVERQHAQAERTKALALQPDSPTCTPTRHKSTSCPGTAASAARDAKLEPPSDGAWACVLTRQMGPCRKQAAAARHDDIAKYGRPTPIARRRLSVAASGPGGVGLGYMPVGGCAADSRRPAPSMPPTLPWPRWLNDPVRDWISFKL